MTPEGYIRNSFQIKIGNIQIEAIYPSQLSNED